MRQGLIYLRVAVTRHSRLKVLGEAPEAGTGWH